MLPSDEDAVDDERPDWPAGGESDGSGGEDGDPWPSSA